MKKRIQQGLVLLVLAAPLAYSGWTWSQLTVGEKAHIKSLARDDKLAALKAFWFKTSEEYEHDRRVLDEKLQEEGSRSLKERFQNTDKKLHRKQRIADEVFE